MSHTHDAAHNNAVWCNTMCRAHGVPGEFTPLAWVNPNQVPPYHSNVVTLAGPGQARNQEALIESLGSACGGVKDSFSCLDLQPLGFEVLFEASWIHLAPDGPHHASDRTWRQVRNLRDLAEWESTWRAEAVHEQTASPRLFLPALLDDPDVCLLAEQHDDTFVTVAIANRTGGVVGLSNVFAPLSDSMTHWPGCIHAVQTRFPGLPIVGYERADDLAAAIANGFEQVGPLRVWIRTP